LARADKLLDVAGKTLGALPVRGRQVELADEISAKHDDVTRASTYVELYGAYTECEAVYGVDRLLGLWDDLDDTDRAAFAFDPRAIDWDVYATEIHLPSVVDHARVNTTGKRKDPDARAKRLRNQILSPDRQFAAFDLEHTILSSNVVTTYAWLASRGLPRAEKARFAARLLVDAPSLLRMDRRDRSDFLRSFYRRYEDAPVEQLDVDAVEHFNQLLMANAYPAALRRVREHRRLGHRTVLITGAMDFVVAPLGPLFDDVVCTRMSTTTDADGTLRYTGRLTEVPPTGESRAQALFDYADANGFDVAEAVAYADATSDLSMLEAVGFPVAVNPEARLAALARKRGWLVEHWEKSSGSGAPLLPLAQRRGRRGDDLLTRLAARMGEQLIRESPGDRKGTARAGRR
ncbi:MAG TPA: HAD-IB family phosphatase, partial [Acidimicrobiales bacterium]|nr:HAD-IB family phosphatase [Acidimicrobiales bacterium]